MATQQQRAYLKVLMDFMLQNRSQISYNQLRPMALFTNHLLMQDLASIFSKGEHIAPDCSEMVTWLCRAGGLHDPSGPTYNYSGFGNTSTMYAYLPHPPNPAVHVGALCVFGITAPAATSMMSSDAPSYELTPDGGIKKAPYADAQEAFLTAVGADLSNQHITMVYAPPTSSDLGTTTLFSHGSSNGPILLSKSAYEAAVPSQGAGIFLSTGVL